MLDSALKLLFDQRSIKVRLIDFDKLSDEFYSFRQFIN